jgi:phosphoribosylaminoimidazole (AIR) synthetase
MIAVVRASQADSVLDALAEAGEMAWVAGEIVTGEQSVVLS